MLSSSRYASSAVASALLRICGGGLSQLATPIGSAVCRGFANGQEMKEGTENFVLLSEELHSRDDDPLLYDPSAERSSAPPTATVAERPSYTPRWQRGQRSKPSQPESSKAAAGGLPDSDPAFRTENDIKDF